MFMFIEIKKIPLNALNLMYCKFHVAQIIIIEDIDNIIKGALEVFLSVLPNQHCIILSLFRSECVVKSQVFDNIKRFLLIFKWSIK